MIKMKIQIDPTLCIAISIALFLLPIDWVLGWFIAAGVHEVSHYIALIACKVDVYGVKVGPYGARISAGPMSDVDELIVAAAGPIGGILLIPLYRWVPSVSLCAIVQSAYNLLPMYPMDGGRILAVTLTQLLGRECGAFVVSWFSVLAAVCLISGGFYLWYVKEYSVMIFVTFVFIAVKSIGKTS